MRTPLRVAHRRSVRHQLLTSESRQNSPESPAHVGPKRALAMRELCPTHPHGTSQHLSDLHAVLEHVSINRAHIPCPYIRLATVL